MSHFKTWAELRQESRYTRLKASGFNVSSAYVLKSDMDLYSPVDAVIKKRTYLILGLIVAHCGRH